MPCRRTTIWRRRWIENSRKYGDWTMKRPDLSRPLASSRIPWLALLRMRRKIHVA
ncbi:hypothetical protein J2T09_002727 [Neorhizobium huautlense]|uniref:Uncharacterized protein n=1 Tax=Neorhizobium huautlense TaxID=67774 RepID=A0ABT9PU28_9HYPH|nr:hypothetical protein [Neorhizobium huautlense]